MGRKLVRGPTKSNQRRCTFLTEFNRNCMITSKKVRGYTVEYIIKSFVEDRTGGGAVFGTPPAAVTATGVRTLVRGICLADYSIISDGYLGTTTARDRPDQ